MKEKVNHDEKLEQLRRDYYEAYPHQRWHIAKQRIENPDHGPNLLVAYVSAIEGMLRSLVIWGETPTGRPSEETYKKFKHWTVDLLFSKYLIQKGAEASDIVPDETYQIVNYAVDYRNLLAHECTYLGQDTYPELIEACETFLQSLLKNAEIS
jgi:hypothetical protein